MGKDEMSMLAKDGAKYTKTPLKAGGSSHLEKNC
jgi:hypothetical protein